MKKWKRKKDRKKEEKIQRACTKERERDPGNFRGRSLARAGELDAAFLLEKGAQPERGAPGGPSGHRTTPPLPHPEQVGWGRSQGSPEGEVQR